MMKKGGNSEKTLIGLRRGLEIIDVLSDSLDGMSFNEIKQMFPGMSPSTLSRLLKTLHEEKILQQIPGDRRYRLGERIKTVAEKIYGSKSKADIIQPILKKLSYDTHESSAFFEFKNDAIFLTAKEEAPNAFHYMAAGGTNNNFASHGFALVCLAYQPETVQNKLLESLGVRTSQPRSRYSETASQPSGVVEPTPLIELQTKLSMIRQEKILVNTKDDQPIISRIVSPVFHGIKGKFAGAIGISTFRQYSSDKQINPIVEAVKRAAENCIVKLEHFRK